MSSSEKENGLKQDNKWWDDNNGQKKSGAFFTDSTQLDELMMPMVW